MIKKSFIRYLLSIPLCYCMYPMKNNPQYVEDLENLSEDLKRAWLYGDWNVFAGQYLPEFRADIHIMKPFKISSSWERYLTFDYGLDMLAAYWIAVNPLNSFY